MLKPLLNPQPQRNRQSQRGISLIEMMVGFVVALVVLWGISVVYLNTSSTEKTTKAATQLNQDLRAMMDIMVGDIRRAGSWVNATSGNNAFTDPNVNLAIIDADAAKPGIGTCILYSYDATFVGGTTAGAVDAGDIFGFRVAGGVLQTLIPSSLTTTATAATDCGNAAIWSDLSDSRAVTMAMSLDTTGSQCVAFDRASYVTTDPTTYNAWATTGGFGVACDPTAPGAPSPYPTAPRVPRLETRQVNITLTATSKTDATLTRTLSDTALVRNNRVMP